MFFLNNSNNSLLNFELILIKSDQVHNHLSDQYMYIIRNYESFVFIENMEVGSLYRKISYFSLPIGIVILVIELIFRWLDLCLEQFVLCIKIF